MDLTVLHLLECGGGVGHHQLGSYRLGLLRDQAVVGRTRGVLKLEGAGTEPGHLRERIGAPLHVLDILLEALIGGADTLGTAVVAETAPIECGGAKIVAAGRINASMSTLISSSVLSSTLAKNLPVHRAREMWNMGSFSTIS